MTVKPIFVSFAMAAAIAGAEPAGAADDILARMAALNPSLHTYTATMRADVAMKSMPFLTLHLTGTYYHKEPDRNKIVFTSGVPLMAEQFDKLYANIEPPSRWKDLYTVSVVGDDGTTTSFRLVPRKHGNVDRIDVRADNATATITSMRWNYSNGGYAEMHDRYAAIKGNQLVAAQTGHVEEPGYSADISSTFDDYSLNVPIADGVFNGQ